MLKERIELYIENEFAQRISNEQNFFFQKGQDALNKWIDMELTREQADSIISLSLDYNEFKKIDTSNRELFPITQLLFEIISYCDNKANGKKHHNQYDDSRTFANAGVRMGAWIRNLVEYKFNSQNVTGSIKNAFNYLLDPNNNTTILSENHRKFIVEYYLKKDYNPADFTDDCKSIFKNYSLSVLNDENYTFYISSLIYSLANEWKPKVSLKFKDLVRKLESHFISEKIEFSFDKLSSRPRFIWISDGSKIIGNHIAHYEIGFRSISANKNEIYVDIHFEGNTKTEKDIFYNTIKNLPENLEWFDWQNSKSIGFKEVYKLDDEDIIDNITSALEYIEDNIGDSIREIISELSITNAYSIENKLESMKRPLNQILYGPPGTGKTYNSINEALEIINEQEERDLNWEDRKAVKNLFDQRVTEGRIVFTTFHQSMSYEDFIEGIKPEEPEKEGDPVIYKIQYGIFRNLCIEASFEIAQLSKNDSTDEVLDFSFLYDSLVDNIEERLIAGNKVELEIKTGAKVLVDSISQNGNIIIKHINGKKTYTVSKNRLTKLNSEIKDLDKVINIADEFKSVIGGSNSSAYWSVLNAIQKEKHNIPRSTEKRKYTFEEKKEVVSSLTKADFIGKKGKPFVLIIDEINRGNVSQIFGELITLIEEDKRLGKDEALEAILPYSKDKFGVPHNLYIIGTMNTADRSVEALDAALRRRFCFEEMPPFYNLEGLQNVFFGHKAFEILERINLRIEKLLDKDHKIGHSYLLNKDEDSIIHSFYNNIIPLLQEYFFGDYSKIGLVLGKGFVSLRESNKESNIFAQFDDLDNGFEDRNIYEIIDYRDELDEKMKFGQAIQYLMNK